jgi:hypothetical protein
LKETRLQLAFLVKTRAGELLVAATLDSAERSAGGIGVGSPSYDTFAGFSGPSANFITDRVGVCG